MTTNSIGLADAIEQLRVELTDAIARGEGQALRFNLNDIKVELTVQITRKGSGKGELSFNVLGAGAKIGGDGGIDRSNTHRITLSLNIAGGPEGTKISDSD